MPNVLVKIVSLLFIVVLINGCCAFSSADCFCNPPDATLTQEAKDWIIPYDDIQVLVYEDENGNLDTLNMERSLDQEWVGGEECGAYGDAEQAVFTNQSGNIVLTFEATRVNEVAFNVVDEEEGLITGYLNVNSQNLIVLKEFITGDFITAYDWNGNSTTVIDISCDNDAICSGLIMGKFTISKDYGLVKYTDTDGNNWTLRN